MWKALNFRRGVVWAAHFCLFIAVTLASAQNSKVLGEVKFQGVTKVEVSISVTKHLLSGWSSSSEQVSHAELIQGRQGLRFRISLASSCMIC